MEIPVLAMEAARLSKDDMIARFGVSKRTLQFWMAKRKLPYVKIGQTIWFIKIEVDHWESNFKRNNPHLQIRSF